MVPSPGRRGGSTPTAGPEVEDWIVTRSGAWRGCCPCRGGDDCSPRLHVEPENKTEWELAYTPQRSTFPSTRSVRALPARPAASLGQGVAWARREGVFSPWARALTPSLMLSKCAAVSNFSHTQQASRTTPKGEKGQLLFYATSTPLLSFTLSASIIFQLHAANAQH